MGGRQIVADIALHLNAHRQLFCIIDLHITTPLPKIEPARNSFFQNRRID
jgi:hypothetical protein